MHIRQMAELDLSDGSNVPLNVCVVSSEFNGPVKNGGIGTATTALIRQLAADGHNVTLLYTLVEKNEPVSGDRPWGHWVESLAKEKITLEFLRHEGVYDSWREKSWRVKEFLGAGDFDVVYFNDHHGNGYYSLWAKRTGLAPFSQQLHCVITHGSMQWVFDINDQYARQASDLEIMGIERRSVELADVVIGPSSYLLHQYEKYGWRLPANTFQQPYPIYPDTATLNDSRRMPVEEIVFFGRLEVRKGLWLFCEAIDRLSAKLAGKTVTFMGRVMCTSGVSSGLQIINRGSDWPCKIKLLNGYDQDEAIRYLSEPGRLAVMPSLADNSPCVIYECMEAGVPFVATLGSGGEELVDPGSWADVMAEPTAESLAARLGDILDRGAKIGCPRVSANKNRAAWTAWHRYLSKNRMKLMAQAPEARQPAPDRGGKTTPLIVILDRGDCSLSLLIENLSSHIRRFGNRAAYLLLSSRQDELQKILYSLFGNFAQGSPISFYVSNPFASEEVMDLIRTSSFVFFIDAEAEMATPFFVLALGILNQQPAGAVSCAVATRRRIDEEPKIESLPSGDLPVLAALGAPIAGSVWATSTSGLDKDLSSLELYDEQADSLMSASGLGQLFLSRCRLAGVPVQILPIVGATEIREESASSDSSFAVKQAKQMAACLGIPPLVSSGSAPWFAMSKFGMHPARSERASIENSRFLPADHPLAILEKKREGADLPELAATLGRSKLALLLAAAQDAQKDRLRQLLDISMKSIRLRPSIELAHLLSRESIMEFGRTPVPEKLDDSRSKLSDRKSAIQTKSARVAANSARDEEREESSRGFQRIRVYADGQRLRVRRNRVQAVQDLVKEPGKLLFFDVPLCGNTSLSAKLRSNGTDPLVVRIKAFDQETGAEMGTASARLVPKQLSELSIQLFEVYVRATIQLDFIGKAQADVTLESLLLQ